MQSKRTPLLFTAALVFALVGCDQESSLVGAGEADEHPLTAASPSDQTFASKGELRSGVRVLSDKTGEEARPPKDADEATSYTVNGDVSTNRTPGCDEDPDCDPGGGGGGGGGGSQDPPEYVFGSYIKVTSLTSVQTGSFSESSRAVYYLWVRGSTYIYNTLTHVAGPVSVHNDTFVGAKTEWYNDKTKQNWRHVGQHKTREASNKPLVVHPDTPVAGRY